MTATLTTARDEIHDAFQAVWDADTPAVNAGVVPPTSYEGRPFKTPQGAAWARIRVRHLIGEQATLTGGLSPPSRTRFNKIGQVIVSVFQPTDAGGGGDTSLAEALALIAKSAFEGGRTASQIWFRDVVPVEVGIDGPWFQINVVASFTYDEFA